MYEDAKMEQYIPKRFLYNWALKGPLLKFTHELLST